MYLYDAGVTEQPIDCLNGLPGTSEIELEPDHDYPLTPMFGCPANPTTNPGGGWSEAAPANGQHYFSNVFSGDVGGWNSWGIDDDTSDGGQYQSFQKTLNPARVKEAFEVGWVMRARARLMSCTTVSAYLFAFQGGTNSVGSNQGGGDGTFRFLPCVHCAMESLNCGRMCLRLVVLQMLCPWICSVLRLPSCLFVYGWLNSA